MTEAFDFGRRSWILKVDIDAEYNMSVWIVERGFPINSLDIGNNIPI